MKNSIIGFFLFFTVLLVSESKGQTPEQNTGLKVAEGSLIRYKEFPSKWVPPRDIAIWLPQQYDPRKKYRVLYMHDGQMLFDSTQTWNKQEWQVDEVMSQLTARKDIQPTIVVGVWNIAAHRHAEYFPQKPFESLTQEFQDSLINQVSRNANTDLFSQAVYSDRYLKFIVQELKPFIDKHYATFTDAQHTLIAGSSMGGLISMYAVLEYPDTFGGAACLSTHWPGVFTLENNPIPQAFIEYLQTSLPEASRHKFYFDHGTETLDRLYGDIQSKVDRVFLAKGYTPSNYRSLRFDGADHSERAWQKRLHIPLEFLLK